MQIQTDKSLEMKEISWWDTWNISHRSKDHNDEISSALFQHVTAIVSSLSQSHPKRILEVACGTGTLSRQLKFSSYHGLDVSPAAIKLASQRAAMLSLPAGFQRPTYESADIHNWAPPSQAFDIAICVDAIAYFHNQKLALKKLAQAVAPSGKLVLTTINPFVYNRIRRTSQTPLKEGSISRWLSRKELVGLVMSAGLKIESSYTILPRGNMGMLRIVNSPRLNHAFGDRGAQLFCRFKEKMGLGQYQVVVAGKAE